MWDSIRWYLANTGIPVNFGITIAVALIVGTVVAGQTFYLFTIENLKQFGALKAIGVTNMRLVSMILLQALTAGALGFSIGTGLAATFFEITGRQMATRGIVLMWQSGRTRRRSHAPRREHREPAEHPARTRSRTRLGIQDMTHEPFIPAVQCIGVRKHFGGGDTRVDALRGVDFSARLGELTFLVGPSGCGKTTVISVIAGLLDRTAGEMSVLGVDVDGLSARDRVLFRRRNLGFVFQQYNLLPALTAAENVAVPLLAAGVARKPAIRKAAALLARLGLESRVNAPPSTLSGGHQQRVAIARALVHEPRLIVCDEPTAALDHASGQAVMELLAANAVHPDRAVIAVSHDSRVFHYAHSIAHMDDGRVSHASRTKDALDAAVRDREMREEACA